MKSDQIQVKKEQKNFLSFSPERTGIVIAGGQKFPT